jgi:hypothetical protein
MAPRWADMRNAGPQFPPGHSGANPPRPTQPLSVSRARATGILEFAVDNGEGL